MEEQTKVHYQNKKWLYHQYWILGKTMKKIGREQQVAVPTIQKWLNIHKVARRPSISDPRFKRFGKHNSVWKGGRHVLYNGYIGVLIRSHPSRKGKKYRYVLEHRLVMEKIVGRYLGKNETVHHLDGDKKNNEPKNLLLFTNQHDHKKLESLIQLFAQRLLWSNDYRSEKQKMRRLFRGFLKSLGADEHLRSME